MRPLFTTALFVTALIAIPAVAQTPASDIGKGEYTENCAVCHGTTGKGDGPMAGQGYEQVADLTTISKRNKGVFPFAHVYDVIDGRQAVKAHGPREMPIWGTEYGKGSGTLMGIYATREGNESFVRGRIVALIGYIYSLQEK